MYVYIDPGEIAKIEEDRVGGGVWVKFANAFGRLTISGADNIAALKAAVSKAHSSQKAPESPPKNEAIAGADLSMMAMVQEGEQGGVFYFYSVNRKRGEPIQSIAANGPGSVGIETVSANYAGIHDWFESLK